MSEGFEPQMPDWTQIKEHLNNFHLIWDLWLTPFRNEKNSKKNISDRKKRRLLILILIYIMVVPKLFN